MSLYTLNKENMETLNTEQKAVQVTDMVNVHGDILANLLKRIEELEDQVARMEEVNDSDNKTQAFDPDLANMADVEDVPDPIGTPKKPHTPKKKSPKKKSPKKLVEGTPSPKDLSMLPFNPTKCRRRLYNKGWGCQCQKEVFENGLCKVDYDAIYGEKKKESKTSSSEKQVFAHGYADEPRPDQNPITGDSHRWRNADGEFPQKKSNKTSNAEEAPKKKSKGVADIRKEILTLSPEKELKGIKKKELLEILADLQKHQVPPQLDVPHVEATVEEDVPHAEATVEEDVPQVGELLSHDLEEELGDELDEYDDVVYQGVEYLVKGLDVLCNTSFEIIGKWDHKTLVATFDSPEAQKSHEEHKEDSEDSDEEP